MLLVEGIVRGPGDSIVSIHINDRRILQQVYSVLAVPKILKMCKKTLVTESFFTKT